MKPQIDTINALSLISKTCFFYARINLSRLKVNLGKQPSFNKHVHYNYS